MPIFHLDGGRPAGPRTSRVQVVRKRSPLLPLTPRYSKYHPYKPFHICTRKVQYISSGRSSIENSLAITMVAVWRQRMRREREESWHIATNVTVGQPLVVLVCWSLPRISNVYPWLSWLRMFMRVFTVWKNYAHARENCSSYIYTYSTTTTLLHIPLVVVQLL